MSVAKLLDSLQHDRGSETGFFRAVLLPELFLNADGFMPEASTAFFFFFGQRWEKCPKGGSVRMEVDNSLKVRVYDCSLHASLC